MLGVFLKIFSFVFSMGCFFGFWLPFIMMVKDENFLIIEKVKYNNDHSSLLSLPSEEEIFYETSRRNIVILIIFWLSYIFAYCFLTIYLKKRHFDNDSERRISPLIKNNSSFEEKLEKSDNSRIFVRNYLRQRRTNLSRLMLLQHPLGRRYRSLSPSLNRLSNIGAFPISINTTKNLTDIDDAEPYGKIDALESRTSSIGGRSHLGIDRDIESDTEIDQQVHEADTDSTSLKDGHISTLIKRGRSRFLAMMRVQSNENHLDNHLNDSIQENLHVPLTNLILSSFNLEFTISVLSITIIIQYSLLIPFSSLGLFVLCHSDSDFWMLQWLSKEFIAQWWCWCWYCFFYMSIIGIPMTLFIKATFSFSHGFNGGQRNWRQNFFFLSRKIWRHVSLPLWIKRLILLSSFLLLFYFSISIFRGNWTGMISLLRDSTYFVLYISVGFLSLISLVAIPLGVLLLLQNHQCISLNTSKRLLVWLPNTIFCWIFFLTTLYVLITSLIRYISGNVIWNFTIVRWIDHILLWIASSIGLTSSAKIESLPKTSISIPWVSWFESLITFYFLSWAFFKGCLLFFFPLTNSTNQDKSQIIRKRELTTLWVSLVTWSVNVSILSIMSGVIDYVQNEKVNSMLPDYLSDLTQFLPDVLQKIIWTLDNVTIFGFPSLLWLIILYRLLLISLLVLVLLILIKGGEKRGKRLENIQQKEKLA